jgi:sec-independent protein translocase protein TatC
MAAELLPPEQEAQREEEGMLRMSILEHLEELRARIIKALYGFGVVFLICVVESEKLFDIVMAPGRDAMSRTGIPGAAFVAIGVMEQFQIIWVWTPLVASLFLASPWILGQLWAFLSPGLYKREKKWAIPFVLCTAGLFLLGGAFGYFIAFRNGMEFLLGIGKNTHVLPLISIEDYFDTFVDLMLGIGVAFELPVLLFFLTLIRVVSPAFLLNHSRYAIMGVVILAAILTPSPDAFNLMSVRCPHGPAFLPRHLRKLSAGVEAREPRIPMEGVSDMAGDRRGSDCGSPGCGSRCRHLPAAGLAVSRLSGRLFYRSHFSGCLFQQGSLRRRLFHQLHPPQLLEFLDRRQFAQIL